MKISNLTPFFIFLFSISLFFGCKKEKLNNNPFEGCCGTEALVDSVGTAKFYVPNFFSPNNDGINDIFTLHHQAWTLNHH